MPDCSTVLGDSGLKSCRARKGIPPWPESRLGATRPQFADEITDTIDKGIAGRGCRLRSIRPGLGDEHALPGQLLLQADGAAIRTDAHGARGVETRQEVLRAIANGDGLRLDLRRVDGQGEFALDVRVNRAGSEGDRQPTTGFEDRQMRRTAKLIWLPSTRSMRAAPDLTRTSLPLRRTVFAWPWMTSTLMGPLTAMASPSMTPTESEGGSSGRAAVAASSAAQRSAEDRNAGHRNRGRRRHSNELEKAATR